MRVVVWVGDSFAQRTPVWWVLNRGAPQSALLRGWSDSHAYGHQRGRSRLNLVEAIIITEQLLCSRQQCFAFFVVRVVQLLRVAVGNSYIRL